jgi:hypothetical protein
LNRISNEIGVGLHPPGADALFGINAK